MPVHNVRCLDIIDEHELIIDSNLQSAFSTLKSTRQGIEAGIEAFDVVSSQVYVQKMTRVIPYNPKFEEKRK